MSARVLLIDYDPCSICRIRGLLGALGLRTIVARDGIAGMQAFELHRPDLTLVQDLIPRRHGFDVCEALKKTSHGRVAPIVLLADLRNGRRHAVFSTGCDGCVEKPIDGWVLVQTIRSFLPEAVPPDLEEWARSAGARGLGGDPPEPPSRASARPPVEPEVSTNPEADVEDAFDAILRSDLAEKGDVLRPERRRRARRRRVPSRERVGPY